MIVGSAGLARPRSWKSATTPITGLNPYLRLGGVHGSVQDVLPDRIFVRKEFPGKRLIDEIDSRSIGVVMIREIAPTQQRDPEQP